MSDTAAPANGAGGGLPPNLLHGSKMTDFFMQGQPPPEEAPPPPKDEQGRFTARPKSIGEAEADAQAADEPINEQQAGLDEPGEALEASPEEAGEKGMLDALPEGKGQKDQPYKLSDLPEDKFIEIKIDGDKEIVSLKELASGHIRRKAFNKFTNIATAAVNEAKQYAQAATTERTAIRAKLHSLMTSAPKLLEFMLDNQPDVAEQFARSYAQIWDNWQKNPDARRQYEYSREQKKLKEEREKLAAERAEYERSQRETESTRAELERLKPAWQRAMKEIGFPNVTPKFRATVNLLCAAAREANGGKLDADDLRDAVLQAHKLHPAEKTVQERRPAPAPQAPPKPRVEPRRTGNGKDWKSVAYNKRMSDPDFFLRR